MAIIYVDPLNGNDGSGDGLSFATAYKTLGFVHSVATDGDEVRIIKSNDPSQLSFGGTWTQHTETIALSSPVTKSINEVPSDWTQAAPVATWIDTFSTLRADGRRELDFTYFPGVGVPSGAQKWAYQTTVDTDFTSFEQVSFLLRISQAGSYLAGPLNGTQVFRQFELKLCSDLTGDVPVHTIDLPLDSNGHGSWLHPFVVNLGVDIGNPIRSIAIYSKSTFEYAGGGFNENVTMKFMNFIASRPASSQDCLTHLSLIGKNLPNDRRFFPVRFIEGANLSIGPGIKESITYTAGAGSYRFSLPGATSASSVYVLDPSRDGDLYRDTTGSLALQSFTKSLTLSGGWVTEMVQGTWYSWYMTQNLYNNSAFDIHSHLFMISNAAPAGRVFTLHRLGFAHFIYGIQTQSSGLTHTIRGEIIQTAGANEFIISSNYAPTLSFLNSNFSCGRRLFSLNTSLTSGMCSPIILKNVFINNYVSNIATAANCKYFEATSVDITNITVTGFLIPETTFKGYNINFQQRPGVVGLPPQIVGTTNDTQQTKQVLIDGVTTNVGWALTNYPSSFPIRFMRYNGNNDDHRTYVGKRTQSPFALSSAAPSGTIFSEFGGDRNTLTGLAWKMSPLDSVYITQENPLELPVVKIYIANANPITVSVWAKRDSLNINGQLILPSSQYGAPTSDVVTNYSAAAGAYNQISINFTPTTVGVVLEVFFRVWGGATHNFWIDDVTVT